MRGYKPESIVVDIKFLWINAAKKKRILGMSLGGITVK